MDTNTPRYSKTSFWQRIALVLFGLFLTLILIETGLRLGGFIILSLQEHRNRISFRQKGAYRILCLGESTTQDQYPIFLEEALNRRNIGIKFSVIDKGVGATNTSIILSQLESNLDTYRPDMVTTMMGVNDMGAHMPYEPVSDLKAINFLRSFRTYKLAQLLWLHIVTRLKELKSQNVPYSKLFLRKIELQQAYAEDEGELNPRNDRAYFELGCSYQEQEKPSEAEESFKKAIELNPRNDDAYARLGRLYRVQGKHSEAEESFKKAIELNPRNDWSYIEIGWFYATCGKYSEAEESFKKAIELNPRNDLAYAELGWFYGERGNFSAEEGLYKKAIELNPRNDDAYARLGKLYRVQGRLSEAEECLKKAVEFGQGNVERYTDLGWFYHGCGRYLEAAESLKKAIECDAENDVAYGALEALYLEMGEMELARKYSKEVRDLRLSHHSPTITSNYRKLKAILDKRGIVYVCIQYPMRSLEPLKKIFQGDDKGIIFVDNEKVFKDEVAKHGRKNYFLDMFGGDFGHCSQKGNRLLAENIAKVILKEVFGKSTEGPQW